MIPDELLYSKSHEWLRIEGDKAVIGITHFAQEQLGDITFVELPEEGSRIEADEEMGAVESVKAASELYAPVDGTVIAVNESLEEAPQLVNEDPYGEGWMVEITFSGETEGLLSADEYRELTEE